MHGTRARWLEAVSRWLAVTILGLSLGACTALKHPEGDPQAVDPFERWNRKVFGLNEVLDEQMIKPVATAYTNIVPSPVRQAMNNFFGNIGDAWSSINLVLQGRFKSGLEQTMRFAINSTFGLVGLIDIATDAGIDRRSEDLGKTFGRWGFGSGPYLVWPLLGPSSVRDTFAMPLDRAATPALLFKDGESKLAIYGLQAIDARASFLGASRVLDSIALDKYTFLRDAYLQRRSRFDDDSDDAHVAPVTGNERH